MAELRKLVCTVLVLGMVIAFGALIAGCEQQSFEGMAADAAGDWASSSKVGVSLIFLKALAASSLQKRVSRPELARFLLQLLKGGIAQAACTGVIHLGGMAVFTSPTCLLRLVAGQRTSIFNCTQLRYLAGKTACHCCIEYPCCKAAPITCNSGQGHISCQPERCTDTSDKGGDCDDLNDSCGRTMNESLPNTYKEETYV